MENVLAAVAATLKEVPPCLVPDVEGFCTAKVRMLLNRLVAKLPPDEAYFEVGVLKGGTLISALLDHRSVTAYANDKWCEYVEWKPKESFFKNLERYKDRLPEVHFLEKDTFDIPAAPPFEKPIGLYFYDGGHTEDEHRRAIADFGPFLAQKCIILVDDWNWYPVRKGTWQGLNDIKPKHLFFLELPALSNGDPKNFHNGVGAFYLEFGPNEFLTEPTDTRPPK
jgi:hypothetical protein